MTDLQRFFRVLVRNLAATDPARLRGPLALTDIRNTIVPYRANRRSLQLESSEDYELVLMKLCAGQEGFARTEPEDVRLLFAAELRSVNPDLFVLHIHENAVVRLEAAPLAEALNLKPDLAFAPPEEAPSAHQRINPGHCGGCGGHLPTYRAVNFCPKCGIRQTHARCPACECEVETGWRHCVACGFLVG